MVRYLWVILTKLGPERPTALQEPTTALTALSLVQPSDIWARPRPAPMSSDFNVEQEQL